MSSHGLTPFSLLAALLATVAALAVAGLAGVGAAPWIASGVALAGAALALLAGRRRRRPTAPRAAPSGAPDDEASRMRFLTHVSHELRTPLTSIRGFLKLLEERLYEGEAERQEFFESSRFAAEHMLQVLDGTLRAARLDRRVLVPEVEVVAGGDAAMEVLRILDALAREKALELRVESSGRGLVRADAVLLRQVLVNLVGNAIKFTERGSVTIRVTEEGERVRFDVEDTGEGIAPEILSGIFRRFHQAETAASRAQGGIGLGLAISREIVELMGGTMRAASDGAGRGACLTFSLPAAVEAAPVPV